MTKIARYVGMQIRAYCARTYFTDSSRSDNITCFEQDTWAGLRVVEKELCTIPPFESGDSAAFILMKNVRIRYLYLIRKVALIYVWEFLFRDI